MSELVLSEAVKVRLWSMVDAFTPERLLALYDKPKDFEVQDGVMTQRGYDGSRVKITDNRKSLQRITKLEGDAALQSFASRLSNSVETNSGAAILNMDFPELEYLAEGLLPQGTSLLCGDPKVGKSLVAMQLSMCIPNKMPLFDAYPCERDGGVVYYCLEDGKRRIQNRLKGFGVAASEVDKVYFFTDAPEIGKGFEEHLESVLIKHMDTRLVIVDPLVKVRPVTGGNSPYREDYRSIASIREVLERYGVSGLVVHHLRKEQNGSDASPLYRISGTQGLAGAADHILIMSKVHGKPGAALIQRISRDADEVEVGLQLDGIRWRYAGDATSVRLSPAKKEVYDVVMTSPEPIGPSRVAEIVGKSKGTVGPQLKDMAAAGEIGEYEGKYWRVA